MMYVLRSTVLLLRRGGSGGFVERTYHQRHDIFLKPRLGLGGLNFAPKKMVVVACGVCTSVLDNINGYSGSSISYKSFAACIACCSLLCIFLVVFYFN